MRYSQYRHALERGSGHLWQSRYYSCPVEPSRLAAVMRYVELNPVRARMVRDAATYEWSSASVHLGNPDNLGLLATKDWNRCWTPEEWHTVLNEGTDDSAAIREATYGGRPLGSEEFVETLELFLNRRLKRGAPGRPRKSVAAVAA
jgi:putative transposase